MAPHHDSARGSRSGSIKTFGLAQSVWAHAALVVFLGLLAYSNTFASPFVFDDYPVISHNPLIRSVSNIPAMFAGEKGFFASRPLMLATMALNYHFGGLDPRGYHAVNVALHLANGVFLYFLVLTTGRLLRYDDALSRLAALLASLVFVLHPVQTDAVNYVVSRSMLLSTAFYLSGIMLFAVAVTSGGRKWPYLAGLFAVSLLGAASRENFITFPVALLLYDLFFISGFRGKEVLRHWKAYVPAVFACVYLIYLIPNNTYVRTEGFTGAGIPPYEYALTQFRVQWTYLRLLAFPMNLSLDYGYPVSRGLLELPAMLSFAGYLGLWAVAITLTWRRRLAGFAFLWFPVTLLPTSFMTVPAAMAFGLRLEDVIFEHRLYLPSAGVIAGVSFLAVYHMPRLKTAWARRTAVCCLALVLVFLAAGAYKRNMVWKSEISLWGDAVRKHPDNARAHSNLGLIYGSLGRMEDAGECFRKAIEIYPGFAEAHNNMGIVYSAMGQYGKAIESFGAALRLRPDNPDVHYNMGKAYSEIGLMDKAGFHLKRAEELKRASGNSE